MQAAFCSYITAILVHASLVVIKMSLSIGDLRRLAAQNHLISLKHGTDLASASDIRQNGLSIANAQSVGGLGDFWATDDVNEANIFALVNPRSGRAARLEFDLAALIIVQLLSTNPPRAFLYANDGIQFLPASFAVLNIRMSNKQVAIVP